MDFLNAYQVTFQSLCAKVQKKLKKLSFLACIGYFIRYSVAWAYQMRNMKKRYVECEKQKLKDSRINIHI